MHCIEHSMGLTTDSEFVCSACGRRCYLIVYSGTDLPMKCPYTSEIVHWDEC